MKILESTNQFKILTDRVIGVHQIKIKNETEKHYWQIFDAKNSVLCPQTFKSIISFNGNVGVIEDFNEEFRIVKLLDDGRLKVSQQSYAKISKITEDGIAIIDTANGKTFCRLEDGDEPMLTEISPEMKNCYLPENDIASIQFADGRWGYAKVTRDGAKVFDGKFAETLNFSENFGRTKDAEGRYHYCKIEDDKVVVLPQDFLYCYPIREGVGRIVNDDLTMNFVKVKNRDIYILSGDFRYVFEFENGQAKIVNHDCSRSVCQKDSSDKITVLQTKEYDDTEQDISQFADGIIVMKNSKTHTVRFALKNGDKMTYLKGIYLNASRVVDGVSRVEFLDGTEGYVTFDDNGIVSTSQRFSKVRQFKGGRGVVKTPDGLEAYVKNEQGYIKKITNHFPHCFDYEKGFGVVKTSEKKFAILDKDGKYIKSL